MKSSQNLISAMFKMSKLNYLSPLYECQRLKIFLPIAIKEALIGIFPKKNQLFFVFKNQIICNEFNKYHTKKILMAMQEHSVFFPTLLQNLDLQTKGCIKGYIPKHHLQTPQILPIQISVYKERSFGTFKNHCTKDSTRYLILESIRTLILEDSSNNKNYITL